MMDNRYGLTKKELEDITAVFRHNNKVEKAILFGSRAKNTHQPGSDIDIAVDGSFDNLDDLLTLISEMEAVDILQKFDLIDLKKITSKELLEHIARVGIIIYEK